MSFDDCLVLLDGRFKQLMTLNVLINNIKYCPSNVYNINDLPNLKYFSLITYYCLSDIYDTEILPLFRRMSNLEELTLYITIKNRTRIIDDNHISNEILIHMPRLYTFNFCFSINIHMDHSVYYVSKDDIQRFFY